MSRRQLGGFLALCLIWGTTWAAIRVVVHHMPPLRSVSLRFLVASAVLLPLAYSRRSRMPQRREWGVLFLLGFILVELPFSLVAWGEQRISSGITSALFATSPLFTAWMEPLFTGATARRRVPRAAYAGILGGLAGAVLVLSGELRHSAADVKSAAAILFVVVAGSGSGILAKREFQSMPVLTVSAAQSLIACLSLGLASLLFERNRATDWTMSAVIALLFLGLISTALGFLLYYWLLMELQPYQLAARQLVMPIVAIAEGSLFLGEPLPWTMVAGTLIVLGSLVIVMRARMRDDDLPSLSSPAN